MINFDERATAIYAQNKLIGWWDDPKRCIYQSLQLVSTEIAEATEGERQDLMDDHIPSRKMGEVELADALIRVLDLGGRFGWSYNSSEPRHKTFGQWDAQTIGAKHLAINAAIVDLARNFSLIMEDGKGSKSPYALGVNLLYSILIKSIIHVANSQGYDIEGAMIEKLEYNLTREDHKRETRTKAF